MGFPAIGIRGFGTVSVCGRNLEPRPAIGTIIFINDMTMFIYYFVILIRLKIIIKIIADRNNYHLY
jgi:hypothetical protein